MQFQVQTDRDGLDRILALINDAYRGTEGAGRWTTEHHLVSGDRIDRASLIDLIEHPRSELIVGRDDNFLACCLGIKKLSTAIEFGTFAVASSLQGRGLGSRLLSYAEARVESDARASRLPFQVCVVSQNTDLIRFYERRGYQRTGATLPYPVDQNVGTPKIDDINLTVLTKAP